MPEDWSEERLGDLLRVRHGFPFKSEFFTSVPTGRVVVTPGNFREEGGFKRSPGKEKYYAEVPPEQYVLQTGDLVVAMTEQAQGLLGSTALIPDGDEYLHNQRIGLVDILDAERLDKRFAYYLFNTPRVRDQIQATATGAKVRHTAPGRIEAVRAAIPPLTVQRKLASVLSHFDDLIENNTRRIHILEEMAQTIYREWFVELRFPGHEGAMLVESELGPIPEGWRVGRLTDELPFSLQKPRVSRYEGERQYIATADCEGVHRLRGGTPLRFDDLPSRAQHKPIGNSVWFGRMAGYRKVLLFPADAPVLTRYVLSSGFACIGCTEDWFAYLACTVCDSAFEPRKSLYATGATQISLTDQGARRIPWLIPDSATVARFSSLTEPMLDLLLALLDQTGVLTEMRDLLLPRLLSGEVDVSDLHIDASGLVA